MVTYDTRGPRFVSSHWQNFIEHLYVYINCVEKTKINKKRGREWPTFKKKSLDYINLNLNNFPSKVSAQKSLFTRTATISPFISISACLCKIEHSNDIICNL